MPRQFGYMRMPAYRNSFNLEIVKLSLTKDHLEIDDVKEIVLRLTERKNIIRATLFTEFLKGARVFTKAKTIDAYTNKKLPSDILNVIQQYS